MSRIVRTTLSTVGGGRMVPVAAGIAGRRAQCVDHHARACSRRLITGNASAADTADDRTDFSSLASPEPGQPVDRHSCDLLVMGKESHGLPHVSGNLTSSLTFQIPHPGLRGYCFAAAVVGDSVNGIPYRSICPHVFSLLKGEQMRRITAQVRVAVSIACSPRSS